MTRTAAPGAAAAAIRVTERPVTRLMMIIMMARGSGPPGQARATVTMTIRVCPALLGVTVTVTVSQSRVT